MKVIYFGTSKFAINPLMSIIASQHQLVAVVTTPDKPQGRGLKTGESPVKAIAHKHRVEIWQPGNVNDSSFVKKLEAVSADIFIVVAYGQILSQEVLDIPKLYSVNIHASLLPKYRGAAPINWAINDGCSETGVSLIIMNSKMDAGDIISQESINITSSDTALSCGERLSQLGAHMIGSFLCRSDFEEIKRNKQRDKEATYARKVLKEDGGIDWTHSAKSIERQIRAFVPWPCAYTHHKGKVIKIFSAEINCKAPENQQPAGSVVSVEDNKLSVITGKGILDIKEMQIEGKKRMAACDFLRGHSIRPGDSFKLTRDEGVR